MCLVLVVILFYGVIVYSNPENKAIFFYSLWNSGDHDMIIPYFGTMNWIESLNLPVESDWRPWFVNEQVAGYTMKYLRDDYSLTFATVKGGGHTTTEYKPEECFHMFVRWIANESF